MAQNVKEPNAVKEIALQNVEEARAVTDNNVQNVEETRDATYITPQTAEVGVVPDIIQQVVEESIVTDNIHETVEESTVIHNTQLIVEKTRFEPDKTLLHAEVNDVKEKNYSTAEVSAVREANDPTVKASAVKDTNDSTAEEASDVKETTDLTAEEASDVEDMTDLTAEEASDIKVMTDLTARLANVLKDRTYLIAELASALKDNTDLTAELKSATKDTTDLTAEEASATKDATDLTAEEASAVIDTTDLTAEEAIAVKDTTDLTAEEAIAVKDTTDLTAEEEIAVKDTTDLTAEEAIAVKDATNLTAEEAIAVKDATNLTAEEVIAVKDTTNLTAEEAIAVKDTTDLTAEEASALKDNDLTAEEVNAVKDAVQMTEEQSSVKGDTRETKELLTAFRDIAEQSTQEPKVTRDTSQRKFGYVKVLWDIENFFFATENEVWEISSPEFDVEGSFVTRWRLILKVQKNNEHNKREAYVRLERLDTENNVRNIRVCWNVWYKIAGEKLPLCNKENVMNINFFLEAPIKNFELFIRSLQFNPRTTIRLEGLILVRGTENGVVSRRFEDLGVKRLSKDLSLAYSISQRESGMIEYESLSDLKINTEGYPLICHRSILSARNKVLNETIEKNKGRSEIDFSFSTGNAGRKIFRYLYSGDLTHILNLPSISMDKAINYLGMDELKCYYLKDSIHLLTRFEAEEMYFKWIVTDLNSNENFLFSPIFSRENSGLALRLRLGLYKDFPRAPFLSLKLEVIERNEILDFYFICGIVNNNGQTVSRRAMKWTTDCEAEIINFTSKSVLRDSSVLENGHLTILCSVFIPKGTRYQTVIKTQKCLRPEMDQERHHRLLSTQLSTLFETGHYADLSLKCREKTFKVHKCVLFARSPVFRRAIRELRDQDKSIKGFSMHEFDPKIVRIILRYVYCGILNCEKEDVLAVYEGSKKLSMVTLQNQLYEILLNNLDASNSIQSLELAVKYADFKLVESVCCFMKDNLKEISQQKNWEYFLREKEYLYGKLLEHARYSHTGL